MSLSASPSIPLPATTTTTTTKPKPKSFPYFFYPFNPDKKQTVKRGTVVGALYGFAQGTVLGIWQDTAIGVHGLSNAFNMAVWTGVFFTLREMVISPALLLLRPTEDHRRRYLLAKLASPKHYDASDPPLGQERWSHIRYRRLIDSGITGGVLGLGAPKFHRWLLHSQGYDALVRLAPRAKVVTFLTAFTFTSSLQLVYNLYTIHDIKLHEAYDSIGPIPNVDIVRVRAQEREDLNRVALYAAVQQKSVEAQKKEKVLKGFQGDPFRDPGDVVEGELGKGVEEGMEWYRWARFRRDALPAWKFISLEERIENEKGRKEMLKSQLEEVRLELEDMGEVMDLVLGMEVKDPMVAVRLNERADKEKKELREGEYASLSWEEKLLGKARE